MFLDLVDSLRCVVPHDASAGDVHLVATIDRLEDRYIADGSLGCPACSARYEIRDFIVDFRAGRAFEDSTPVPALAVDEHAILRAAALLDARSPGGYFILAGEWGRLASGLAFSYDVSCLLLNPPRDVLPGIGVSIARVSTRVPAAAGSARGVAADAEIARVPTLWDGSILAVRGGGRVVAPSSVATPGTVTELARDERWWVAERVPDAPQPLPLVRLRR